jgi:hypothetical protein
MENQPTQALSLVLPENLSSVALLPPIRSKQSSCIPPLYNAKWRKQLPKRCVRLGMEAMALRAWPMVERYTTTYDTMAHIEHMKLLTSCVYYVYHHL